ncbi:hypothetical protein BDW69DRAFT_184701 [Aspergillus filifer]
MFCRARNRAVAACAYRLLANALGETGDCQALIVQELENLCDSELQSLFPDNVLFDGQPAVSMGVWHRINGRKQDARKCFKPYTPHAITWRDQKFNETETSTHVYRALGHLLAMAGDDEDEIALLQLVHSPFTVRDGTSASPEERMASPWPLLGTDAVWFCHICLYSVTNATPENYPNPADTAWHLQRTDPPTPNNLAQQGTKPPDGEQIVLTLHDHRCPAFHGPAWCLAQAQNLPVSSD